MTAYAVKQFLEIDANKDRFLNEEELKQAQEAEHAKQDLVELIPPPPASRGRRQRRRNRLRRPHRRRKAWRPACRSARDRRQRRYSTVTLLARLRGWSTSVPLATAV